GGGCQYAVRVGRFRRGPEGHRIRGVSVVRHIEGHGIPPGPVLLGTTRAAGGVDGGRMGHNPRADHAARPTYGTNFGNWKKRWRPTTTHPARPRKTRAKRASKSSRRDGTTRTPERSM